MDPPIVETAVVARGSHHDFQRLGRGEQHGQRRFRAADVPRYEGHEAGVVGGGHRHGRGARAANAQPGIPAVPVPQLGYRSVGVRAARARRDAQSQVQVPVRAGQPVVPQHAGQISVCEYIHIVTTSVVRVPPLHGTQHNQFANHRLFFLFCTTSV